MFNKSLDPAGTWLIDNKTGKPKGWIQRIDHQ